MSRRGKPRSASDSEQRGIQSVEVSAVILKALAQSDRAMSLKKLSDAIEMPPSKAHRYLASFVRAGLVRQDAASGEYDLGLETLRIGLSALARVDIIDRADESMRALTEQLDLTSLLTVWGPHGATLVRWRRTAQPLVTSLGLGAIFPLTQSATGHIFLAYSPSGLINDVLKKELAANRRRASSNNAPTTKKEVDALIAKIRRAGCAYVDSSFIPGLRATAAPILDSQNEVAAAVTLMGTDQSLITPESEPFSALKSACEKLSVYKVSHSLET